MVYKTTVAIHQLQWGKSKMENLSMFIDDENKSSVKMAAEVRLLSSIHEKVHSGLKYQAYFGSIASVAQLSEWIEKLHKLSLLITPMINMMHILKITL